MSARHGGAAFWPVVIAGVLFLVGPEGRSKEASAQPPVGGTFYYNQGQRIPLDISLTEIGIVARAQISRDIVLDVAPGFTLKYARTYANGIAIFELQRQMQRQEIVRLARDLTQRRSDIVRHVGLLATPKGAEAPFIITDEFIANFVARISPRQIEAFNRQNGVQIVRPDRFVRNQYLLRVTDASRVDALDMANRYQDSGLTTFSHPNFARVVEHNQAAPFIPDDPMFADQWHHQNTGQSGGTPDADVDAPLAWAITQGDPNVVIAVIDNGFDIGHEDLAPNVRVNTAERPGNNLDDDGNGFVDDVNGWDFTEEDGDPRPGPDDHHGTAVAGVAVARGNNAMGVSGVCPKCRLIPIREGTTYQDDADAITYAWQMGASIISNSWAYPNGTPVPTVVANAIKTAATDGRGGLGSVVLFGMLNHNVNDCTGNRSPPVPGVQALSEVIAVSVSTNWDRRGTESGFGDCLGLLAPSSRGYGPLGTFHLPYTGTLNIVTTDRSATTGYNNMKPWNTAAGHDPTYCPVETSNLKYTMCFGGTSASTPLVAGIAGLILSVNSGLTARQVRLILQDTADRIEDSMGAYSAATGFSSPASGASTHGWGRANAFESVRVVAPASVGGRGGADIFVRDNRLDWGNTEQPSSTLFERTRGFIPPDASVDIKVDAPPFVAPGSTGLLAAFEGLQSELPQPGQVNRVYLRVRNRGPVNATSVTVKMHWVDAVSGVPGLPPDFWSVFPGNSTNTASWHPLPCSTIAASNVCTISNLVYSGPSIAGCPGRTRPDCADGSDGVQIVSFDFQPPTAEPFALFGVIDSIQDHVGPLTRVPTLDDFQPAKLTPSDNNVALQIVRRAPAPPTNLRTVP